MTPLKNKSFFFIDNKLKNALILVYVVLNRHRCCILTIVSLVSAITAGYERDAHVYYLYSARHKTPATGSFSPVHQRKQYRMTCSVCRVQFEQRPVRRLDPDGPGDHVHVGELRRQAGGRAVGAAAGAVRAVQPAGRAAQRAEGAAALGRAGRAAQAGLGRGRLRRHPAAARLRAAQGQRPPRRVHRRQVDVQSDTPRDIIFSIQ